MPYMKATLILREKLVMPDGAIIEFVIWRLPEATSDRPHGLKYRLFYGTSTGECLVRYDNETGKGDHIHFGVEEVEYEFESVRKLRSDFWRDVKRIGGYEDD
jgi:Family of unknown function (DUF6516)